MKHDRASVIAIIKEKRRIEQAVRGEARKAIESVDAMALLNDPENTIKTFFAARGIQIVAAHAGEAKKAGERFVEGME
jgi:hypothetical protein